jgi:hypothetical protein
LKKRKNSGGEIAEDFDTGTSMRLHRRVCSQWSGDIG